MCYVLGFVFFFTGKIICSLHRFRTMLELAFKNSILETEIHRDDGNMKKIRAHIDIQASPRPPAVYKDGRSHPLVCEYPLWSLEMSYTVSAILSFQVCSEKGRVHIWMRGERWRWVMNAVWVHHVPRWPPNRQEAHDTQQQAIFTKYFTRN